MDEVGPVGEGADERNREPVPNRFAEADLILHVVREVRERVALRRPPFVRNLLVAPGERHRLERQEVDLLWIVEGELDDPADLLVVHAVDDGRDRNDVDAGRMQVLNRPQLDVEQVADQAVRIGGVANPVELQVRVTEARLESRAGEIGTLRELDSVRRRLHAAVANLLRVAHGVQEVRRHRRLAA